MKPFRYMAIENLEEAEKKLKNKSKVGEYSDKLLNNYDEHRLVGGEDSPAENFKKRLIADGEEEYFNELLNLGIITQGELGKNEWDSDIVQLVSF